MATSDAAVAIVDDTSAGVLCYWSSFQRRYCPSFKTVLLHLDRERVENCERVKCAFECFETLTAFAMEEERLL